MKKQKFEVGEIWVQVKNNKTYQISNFGRVRSVDRYVLSKGRCKKLILMPKKGKILKTDKKVSRGYESAILVKNGKKITYSVHKLVAEHFCKKPTIRKNLCVNHIDGNTRNNKSSNLEWVSYRYNYFHGYLIRGKTAKKWGEKTVMEAYHGK